MAQRMYLMASFAQNEWHFNSDEPSAGREILRVGQLPADFVSELRAATVDAKYAHLDELMKD